MLQFLLSILQKCRREFINSGSGVTHSITTEAPTVDSLIKQIKTCTNMGAEAEDESDTPSCREGAFCEACISNKRLLLQACFDGNLLRTTLLFSAIGPERIRKFRDRSGATPLFYAARGGNIHIVLMLLKNGLDVNAQDYLGCTPFMDAIQSENIPAMELLLKVGADPHHQADITPFMAACFISNPKMFATLLEYINFELNPPPTYVWQILNQDPNPNCFKLLSEKAFADSEKNGVKGVNNFRPIEKKDMYNSADYKTHTVQARESFMKGAQSRAGLKSDSMILKPSLFSQKKMVSTLKGPEEALLALILNNDAQELKKLLEKGLKPDSFLRLEGESFPISLLSLACDLGNLETVAVLLTYKADPNVIENQSFWEGTSAQYTGVPDHHADLQEKFKSQLNRKIYSALRHAISNEHVQIVSILLEHGANPNKKIDRTCADHTPLMQACLTTNGLIVYELLKAKANPNVGTKDKTPLHYSVEMDNVGTFKMLLRFGAKLNLSLSNTGTPLDVAKRLQRKEIIAIIEAEEARLAAADAARCNASDLLESLKSLSKELTKALNQYENKNEEIKEKYDAIKALLTQNNNSLQGAVYSTHKKNAERSCKSFKETNERREKEAELAWQKLVQNYDAFTSKHKVFVELYGRTAPKIKTLIFEGELESAKSQIGDSEKDTGFLFESLYGNQR